MAKKKTKKPHGTKSLYCRGKADRMWSRYIRLRDGKCVICGKIGEFTKNGERIKGLEAHHLVGKNTVKYRHVPDNGVALCHYHHKCDNHIVAHGSNDAVGRFMKELPHAAPDQYLWYMEHCDNKTHEEVNYQDNYDMLEKLIDEVNHE